MRDLVKETDCSVEEANSYLLKELLAVLHRDGGHYTEFYGTLKASEDALKLLAEASREEDRRYYRIIRRVGQLNPTLSEILSQCWYAREEDMDDTRLTLLVNKVAELLK